MTHQATAEIRDFANRWDQAMLTNDPAAIGAFMADEWVIIGPDGSVTSKDNFLALVESGDVSHDVMETREMEIRVYGTTAIGIGQGVSGGKTSESHSS